MIEVISDERCIDCDLCVKVCPTNVFDPVPDGHPVIARQDDCQTCFLCEAYCPVDAMFVAPVTDPVPVGSAFLDEQHLIEANLLGKYRRDLGWSKGLRPSAGTDDGWRLFSQFASVMAKPPGPTPPTASPGPEPSSPELVAAATAAVAADGDRSGE